MYWEGNLQVSVWFISIDNKRCFSNYEIISITLETSSHFAKIFEIGTETITCRDPQIGNLIPENIKNVSSLENFKSEIKKRKCKKCC